MSICDQSLAYSSRMANPIPTNAAFPVILTVYLSTCILYVATKVKCFKRWDKTACAPYRSGRWPGVFLSLAVTYRFVHPVSDLILARTPKCNQDMCIRFKRRHGRQTALIAENIPCGDSPIKR